MIRVHIIFALLMMICVCLSGNYYDDLDIANLYQVFNVPEIPAFVSLGLDPNKTISPIDDNAISFSLPYGNIKEIPIPPSLAVEMAVIQLLKKEITIKDYRDNPLLYNTRLSLATASNDDGARMLAFGFRLKLIDKGDLKNQDVVLDRILSEYHDELMKNVTRILPPNSSGMQIEEAMDRYAENYGIEQKLKEHEATLEEWNKLKMELSIAVAGISSDSLLCSVKLNAIQAWFSVSNKLFHLGKTATTQYIFCPSVQYSRNDERDNINVFAPFRMLSKFQCFSSYLELQYMFVGADSKSDFKGVWGIFFEPIQNVWLDFQLHVKDIKFSDSETRFNIKYSIPRLTK